MHQGRARERPIQSPCVLPLIRHGLTHFISASIVGGHGTDATAMRQTLHFIAMDLGMGAILTSGLAAFWLLCMDAANDDVAALAQRASRDQRASEYVESVTREAGWPSHGQLIVAQVTVSEILNHAPGVAQ